MSSPAKLNRPATYDDLLKLPDTIVGEIVDGELYASPRPSPKHSLAEGGLTEELRGPFQSGKGGGPGGWWILAEPEIHLGVKSKEDIFVPDLAGWRKLRLPKIPDEPYLTLPPDWICEILSPSNAHLDRVKKVPKYAEYGIPHLWLVDPVGKTLEVFRLENKKWVLLQSFGGTDKVRAEPFEAMELDLATVWGD
jgi:Uma2 family endonuclease